MRLHIYHGLDYENEKVPEDVTHVIVDNCVTVIKFGAFSNCELLVSLIMGDSVKRIEEEAFFQCFALRFVRLSKTLEYIEFRAFWYCNSLEALFLPSTVEWIEYEAFESCESLRLLILPHDIDLNNVGKTIIPITAIYDHFARTGVAYEYDEWGDVTDVSNLQVNEWLIHEMDVAPFHKLCYNSTITTKHINDYLREHGNDSALAIDPIHGMTPLHILSMNPYAPADAIAALFNFNMQAVFCADNQQNNPLEYARDYNVGGLIQVINGLCNHRNSSHLLVESDNTNIENAT